MNATLENATDFSTSIADLSISLILVLPSNAYVLWLIVSGAGGTIVSELFYLNLIASVIMSLLPTVFYFATLFTNNKQTLEPVYNVTYVVFYWLSVPSFQCCICVERYIAVVHPVVFLRYKALRYRAACCCVVWLLVIALGMFCLVSEKVVTCMFMGFCIVCIAVLSFCCLAVLRALKQPGPGEGQKDNGNGMKRRAFRIILISLLVMVVIIMSYIPYTLSLSLTNELSLASSITYILSRVSGVVHPLLYIYKVGKLPCFN